MLQLHPGIYPALQLREEDLEQTIRHCVGTYKIESDSTTRERRVVFGLNNLRGVSSDIIACIAFVVFDSLYRAGCTTNSRILLQVTVGGAFESERPIGNQYALEIPIPLATSKRGISHAYAFVNPEQCTGFLCFYLNGAVDEAALDQTLAPSFSRQYLQEPSISIIQRVINFILSLNCMKIA